MYTTTTRQMFAQHESFLAAALAFCASALPAARLTGLVGAAILVGALAVAPAQAALIAHWTLDEGAGQVVGDSAGSAHGTLGANATPAGDDPVWTTAAKIGSHALTFNGSSQWVNFGDVLDQGTNDFSVSLWLNASGSLTTADAGGRLIQSRGTGAVNAGWQLVVHRDGTAVQISNAIIADGTNRFMIFGNGDASPFAIGNVNEWMHLVSVFDRGNDRWQFHVNGSLVQDFDVSAKNLGSFDNDRLLTLGASDETLGQFFNGSLDDPGMFSGTLTPAQIRAIYTLGDNTDPLGNGADLNYDLGYAQALFDTHNDGPGSSTTLDGLAWFYASDLTTNLGELTKLDGFYFLRLTAEGTGLTTVAPPPIPEPSTLLLLAGGLAVGGRRRPRRESRG